MSLIRLFSTFLDENGYPGTIQSDGTYDGGDTAAIIGTVYTLTDPANIWQPSPMSASLPITHVGLPNGTRRSVPLRHWDYSRWYGRSDRFSRDQLIPNICAGIVQKTWTQHLCLYTAHKQRYFLTAWNTKGNGEIDMPNKYPDLCGPEVWALWIRYKRPWWRHLVLNLLDVQTLIGAIQWRWFTPKTNQITRNHMLVSIVAASHSPTIMSRLTYWLNDWQDLTDRWQACNEATGEYPTWKLFKQAVGCE